MDSLKYGDTIGIISPSWVADPHDYERFAKGLEQLGFQVKFGRNIYKDTNRYTASAEERADDLNEMVYDETVKLIFFGGGFGSVDLLPYIDYKKIKETPKLFLSYSDGTSILNAIYAQTGITTYYGQTPGLFDNISEYNRNQFISNLVEGTISCHVSNSNWYTITEGCCKGKLIGGYLLNFVLSLGNPYFPYPTDERFILFIEELDKFQSIQGVGMFLTCLGQSQLMKQVRGLLFGHYSDDISPHLFEILERFGKKYSIPIAYCDDFGHGENHAILPIGKEAVLDTGKRSLIYPKSAELV